MVSSKEMYRMSTDQLDLRSCWFFTTNYKNYSKGVIEFIKRKILDNNKIIIHNICLLFFEKKKISECKNYLS